MKMRLATRKGNDEQARKTKIRQEHEDSDLEARAEGLGTIPSESQSSRDVEISVSTEVSQGRDTDRFSDTHRGTTAGGIIRELLDENDELTAYHSSQIDFHNNRLKQLSTRRTRLERLYAELQVKTGEDLDDENEVGEQEDEVGDSEALLRSPLAFPKGSADRINESSDEEE